MRAAGAILLVACYELGHQPLNLASPLATLRQAGFSPVAVDTSVSELSDDAIAAAQLVAISAPMHTALRLGARVGARVRTLNPTAHTCFYGLYATLNADYLLRDVADSIIGGEYEETLLALAESLESSNGSTPEAIPGVRTRDHDAAPVLVSHAGNRLRTGPLARRPAPQSPGPAWAAARPWVAARPFTFAVSNRASQPFQIRLQSSR